MIGSLLVVGALDPENSDALAPLQDSMIVGVLPFTLVVDLMATALAKALFKDGRRNQQVDGELRAAKETKGWYLQPILRGMLLSLNDAFAHVQ